MISKNMQKGNNMGKKLVMLIAFKLFALAIMGASINDSYVLMKLLVLPFERSPKLLCRLENNNQNRAVPIITPSNNSYNGFTVYHLGKEGYSRISGLFLGETFRAGVEFTPNLIVVEPFSSYNAVVELSTLTEDRIICEFLKGNYSLWQWQIIPWQSKIRGNVSNFVCVGLPNFNNIITLKAIDPTGFAVKLTLAFIFHENQPHEIGFLLLNGSDKTITIEKPLTQASCIVATAPAIDYTKELHIAGQALERIAIQPGKVGEWRIPWPTIHDLIPVNDLAAIKAAGGDLDLAWRVGAYQSDPLPLSLAPPAVENGAVGEDNQQEVGR